MTEISYYAAISLDGFIAKPDGDVDWLNKYLATGEDYGFARFNASIEAIIMGRATYEKSLEFDTWMAGETPCWVFSSQLTTSNIESVKFTSSSPEDVLVELSNANIQRAWLMGGGKLAASFLAAGLIHEFDLAIMPELLGDGIPLLQPVRAHAELELVDSTVHPSGVVQLKYRKKDSASRMMFTHAIVRTPSKAIVNGLTTSSLGLPDYRRALKQHQSYVDALKACGLNVIAMPPDSEFPDSCFVEDTALLTKRCAIIARLGAATRLGEEADVREMLTSYFDHIESIEGPGTVEPGDIMMVGDHFYIGLSDRTNASGARQMITLLEKHGLKSSTVEMSEMLHLKTGLSYLENNTLVACGEFLRKPEFANFNLIAVDADESYAANCIWVNGTVIVPAGFPTTSQKIEDAGYAVISIDMSEFQKLDGGLSCLSLRF